MCYQSVKEDRWQVANRLRLPTTCYLLPIISYQLVAHAPNGFNGKGAAAKFFA
jgi:hypothetical protein